MEELQVSVKKQYITRDITVLKVNEFICIAISHGHVRNELAKPI